MIRVQGLNKQFGTTQALTDLSFDVDHGEVLGFLGPNGAGKTTTMKILTGYLTPTSGSVQIDDLDIVNHSYETRKKIGYMPESVPLYKDMRVQEYLRFVSGLKSVPRHQRDSDILNASKQCGIADIQNRIIKNLSKGYRQRVGLAQALLGDPKVLILDEPTEGLDPKQITEIRQLIRDLSGKRTVLLSTHILPEVSMVCNRVIILNKGKLIAVDTPENLDKNMQKQSFIDVIVRGPLNDIKASLEEISHVSDVNIQRSDDSGNRHYLRIESGDDQDVRGLIAQKIVRSDWELLELKRESLSLEDIFIHLVTQEQEVESQ